MKHFDRFIFDRYEFDPESREIRLHYALADSVSHMSFVEKIILPKSGQWSVVSGHLDAALFALHLIGGISYYKTCLPKTIEVRSGKLTEKQAQFWNAVYEHGLGEFFYKNNIDFRGLVRFSAASDKRQAISNAEKSEHLPLTAERSKLLVPIGGGKDSVVTIELLKKAGHRPMLFRIGHHPLIEEEAKVAGLPLLSVERHLSPLLFKLNEEGALNGHVPITAYLSILSVIVAILEGYDVVVMSNERSANIGNVTFKGMEINHQWSKSLEFETMFQEYIRDFLGSPVNSFSLLRPFSELHIAKMFTAYPQYFHATTSCNTNWRILTSGKRKAESDQPKWCGKCPKCAFVFACLAAYLPEPTLVKIFGSNFFADEKLLPLYCKLLGTEGFKPFECVGTPEETAAAFILANRRGDLNATPAMQMFVKEVFPTLKNPDALITEAFTPSEDHAIPSEFLSALPDADQ